jgi:RimJ/RimL family protein N-acetyltransferase
MKDHSLLEATGSEPLSLEEEMEMQQSWRDDPKKCTFIVHSTEACPTSVDASEMSDFSVRENQVGMIGDVNLFLSEIDDDGNDDDEEGGAGKVDDSNDDSSPRVQAEIDIMIAEKNYQKKGLGRAATCSMLLYGVTKLEIQRFFCKINDDNVASINLFKSLGFVQCAYAECFKQVELELKMSSSNVQTLLGAHGNYREVRCP